MNLTSANSKLLTLRRVKNVGEILPYAMRHETEDKNRKRGEMEWFRMETLNLTR